MDLILKFVMVVLSFLVVVSALISINNSDVGLVETAIPMKTMRLIHKINREGPILGVVVPNAFEMIPLLQSPSFVADEKLPYIDFSGKRFRFGKLATEKVIILMTGLGMLNAGLATQLLLSLFKVKGVLHFGTAGNAKHADPNLQIGDVTIPRYWAHTGLWNWQKFGDGPDDELSLESNGDYTRRIGYLNFSDYNTDAKAGCSSANLLNSVWYQPEETFPIDGIPEVRQHVFWVPVDDHYFAVAEKLEHMKLEGCINSTTCLPRPPTVIRVERGSSASAFDANAAYREFLNSKFNVTAMDMESAAVALVCLQQRTPFIAFRALSGGGISLEAAVTFAPLAPKNAVDVLLRFIASLEFGSESSWI